MWHQVSLKITCSIAFTLSESQVTVCIPRKREFETLRRQGKKKLCAVLWILWLFNLVDVLRSGRSIYILELDWQKCFSFKKKDYERLSVAITFRPNFTLSFDRLRQRNALKFVRTCSTIIVSHSINHRVVVCFVVCVAFCRRRFLNSSRKTRNGNTFFYSADKVNMHISHLILFFSTTHFPRLFLRLGMQLQRASEILFNTQHLERL